MGLKTVEQLRQARAALGWTQKQVADAAGVSVPTIKRLEASTGYLAMRVDTLVLIEKAFTEQGITFLNHGEESVGFGVSINISLQQTLEFGE
ncbi:helix-turn-helix transcriptional regulator [Roseibium sp. TrichSKD4]|uniref:helix-turn-helix transcriptional regulator n=1 Tax=Roseibium sp. TrichSKD4 TaxID=744980 RepID=UPI00058B8B98|nr:helix-turn-helix transcriptional regulator [Roseibium sp. TrichSKD4]